MSKLTLTAIVSNSTITEQVEGVITSTGLVYSAYQAAETNIPAMVVAFNIYKSIQSALASSIGSMPLSAINRYAYELSVGKTAEEVDALVEDISHIIVSKRQQALMSSRTILCADKPFDMLQVAVLKKKRGAGRDNLNLFGMIAVKPDTAIGRYQSQNALADSLTTRDLLVVTAGQAKADLDTLNASLVEQNMLQPKYVDVLAAKAIIIDEMFTEARRLEVEGIENAKKAAEKEAAEVHGEAPEEKEFVEINPDQQAMITMQQLLLGMSSIENMRYALELMANAVNTEEKSRNEAMTA